MNPDKITVSSSDTFTSSGGDLTARNVSVSAYVDTPTMFMSMMGINDLESTMGSGAEEAIMNIEISLIEQGFVAQYAHPMAGELGQPGLAFQF